MEQIDFRQTIERLKDTGFSPVPNTVEISIPDAKNVLRAGIKYFTGRMPDGFRSMKRLQTGWPAMEVVGCCASAIAEEERPLFAEGLFL